jgi:hypothetical protein
LTFFWILTKIYTNFAAEKNNILKVKINLQTMRQIFYLLFFVLLNATITPTSIYAQNVSYFAGGDGSEHDPFQIEEANQLILITWNYCGKDHVNTHFRLIKDIQLTGQWMPIGNAVLQDNKFTGYFHGGGHKISGLQINNNLSSG